MKEIKIKYFSEDYPRLEKIPQGDWIDLSVDTILKHNDLNIENCNVFREDLNIISYEKGDVLFLGLGVAMKLPDGYEAHVLPRSSTFKKTGLLLTNGMGIIDNAYQGNDDEWKVMVIATRDGEIERHQTLFQFRIVENQPGLKFNEVKKLSTKNRGGYGSTDNIEQR